MSKFKVGDRVVVSDGFPFYSGRHGVVITVDDEPGSEKEPFYKVGLDEKNINLWILESYLYSERKQVLKMEFKLGDKVKILSETKSNYDGKCIGKIGVVTAAPTQFTKNKYDSIGVKIEGMSNINSAKGYFYFKSKDLVSVEKVAQFHILDEMHSDFTDNIFNKLIEQDMNNRKCTSYLRIDSIEKVVFNPPATIIFWKDGTKTVVKCREDEEFDPEKGLSMAITKKALGNKHNYYETFWKFLPKEYKKNAKQS